MGKENQFGLLQPKREIIPDPYSANWLDSGHKLEIQPRQFLDSLFYPVLLSSVTRQKKQDHLRIDSQSYQDLRDCLLTNTYL